MSKAKITKAGGFDCAPEGHTVVNFPYGEVVFGKVAEWALSANAASRMMHNQATETKVVEPSETKKRGRPKKKAKQ